MPASDMRKNPENGTLSFLQTGVQLSEQQMLIIPACSGKYIRTNNVICMKELFVMLTEKNLMEACENTTLYELLLGNDYWKCICYTDQSPKKNTALG